LTERLVTHHADGRFIERRRAMHPSAWKYKSVAAPALITTAKAAFRRIAVLRLSGLGALRRLHLVQDVEGWGGTRLRIERSNANTLTIQI